MAKLVVNPRSPNPWEIQLKPGANFLGRGFSNDFKIDDPSVSGSHCQVMVDRGGALIKDLGSTNGTFVDRNPVQEASLKTGQTVHLGGVEMVFHGDTPGIVRLPDSSNDAPAAPSGAPARSTAPAVRIGQPAIRLAASAPTAHTHAPVAAPAAAHTAPPMAPAVPTGGTAVMASNYCKFHPKTPARFFCNKCNKSYCELCVTTRGEAHNCRACGAPCVPVQVKISRPVTRGFFVQFPGAFIYPFKGSGLLVLIVATILFSALDVVGGGFSIFAKIFALGYLFSFMQNIIHATAAEEKEMPSLPGFDGLFGAFLSLAGVVTFCFGIPIGLAIAKFFFDVEISWMAIIVIAMVFSLYFPMAFLAVAMKDSVMAANPLVVMPAIFKAPFEYLLTAVLLTCVFGARMVGTTLLAMAKSESYATRDMSVLFMMFGFRAIGSFVSIYLLTVGMRILGLLYVTKKHKFGWFAH